MWWRVKQVALEGGKLVHTYRTLSEEICHFFNGGFNKIEDGGRWEDGFGWNITLRQRGDRAGICILERVCMQLLNADMLMRKKNKKTKRTRHLLVMLKKQNYANWHHHYMCTSPWSISHLLSECYTRRVQICCTLLLHFAIIFFLHIPLVNKHLNHFNEHAITVVPKTWEVQC